MTTLPPTEPASERGPAPQPRARLLDAILPHVAFEGWSDAAFRAAAADAGIDPALARSVCPRGAVDLAIDYHARGDAAMVAQIRAADLSQMRFRDRIAFAVRARIEAVHDREAVRRGATLFSLPQHAVDGARLVWGTCDLIWTELGDRSDDFNWYSKRATLAGVYSSTLLFWLGDTSAGHQATWEFLDRRIDDVMRIEKLKAKVNANPVLSRLAAGPNWVLGRIRPPSGASARTPRDGLPGRWTAPR